MRNGSGTYYLPTGYNPVVPNTVITSDWANITLNDVAAGISQSISRDGQTTITADLPMSGYKHLNVSNPTARNQYASLTTVQDNQHARVSLTGGTANALVGNMAIGAPTTYTNGMLIWLTPSAANTGAVTINLNGIGVKSILSPIGGALAAGDLVDGQNYYAYYDAGVGSGAFIILNEVSGTSRTRTQNVISGWLRPSAGTYPTVSLAGTDVTVPAGTGTIVQPTAGVPDGSEFTSVTWAAQTETLTHLGTDSSTTLAIDSSGALVQIAGRASATALRDYIIVGYVAHPGGANPVAVTAPAIYGDDGYAARDTMEAMANSLIAGGKIAAGVGVQTINVAAGSILKAGANSATADAPNILAMAGGTAVTLLHLNGTDDANYAAGTTALDVANYDPNFATNGALVGLGANEWAFHRMFYLYGKYIIVYGQQKYTASIPHIHEVMAMIAYDTTKFVTPLILADAAYLGAIAVSAAAAGGVLDNGTTSLIFAKGGSQYGIQGAYSTGFADAPADGSTYGRRNNAWAATLSANNPVLTGSGIITGNDSIFEIENSSTGESGIVLSNTANTRTAEVVRDNTTGVVNFNGKLGVTLQTQWTWDPVAGGIHVPVESTVGGDPLGNVVGPASCGALALAQYADTSGKVLQDGPRLQFLYDDDTSGLVLVNGSWGLGTDGALALPRGTTAERPNLREGEIRFNTDLQQLEYNAGFSYLPIQVCPPGFISGMTINTALQTVSGATAAGFTVTAGMTNMLLSTNYVNKGVALLTALNKTLTPFSLGDNGGAHGVTPSAPGWMRVFAIWKDDYTCDVGVDSDSAAVNLLAAANALSPGFLYYRRIGWVYYTDGFPGPGSYEIRAMQAPIEGMVQWTRPSTTYTQASFNTTAQAVTTVMAAPDTLADFVLSSRTTAGSGGDLYANVYSPSYGASRVASASEYNYRTQRIGSGADVVNAQTMQVRVNNASRLGIIWSAAPTGSWAISSLGYRDDRMAP